MSAEAVKDEEGETAETSTAETGNPDSGSAAETAGSADHQLLHPYFSDKNDQQIQVS
jgi:hypothetical protein